MIAPIPTGWDDPQSHMSQTVNSNNMLVISGTYFYNNAEFKFSLRQQSRGKYIIRGRISPISAADGHIMQVRGKARQVILQSLAANGTHPSSSGRIQALNVTREIHGNSLDLDDIKQLISDAALKLYMEHATQIHHTQGTVARPDTITPAVAATMYVDDYLRINHKRLTQKSCMQYRHTIMLACSQLPHIPMAKYTVKMMRSALASTPLSKQSLMLLQRFWLYCLNKHICKGSFPFAAPRTTKKDPIENHGKLNKRTELSLDQLDQLYELTSSRHSGGDCGVALLVLGGLSARIACSLVWADLMFDPQHKDYVRIKIRKDDLAGATHDYTFPIFPAGALTLWARREELLSLFTPDQLTKMPVVSLASDPNKAMSPDTLVQHAGTVLRTIGITDTLFAQLRKGNHKTAASSLLLHNTYSKLITTRCGLSREPGTVAFLLHESLVNVTDNHYTSFSDADGNARLHTLMSAVQPLSDIPQPPTAQLLSNGLVLHQYAPAHTRQRVGIVCDIVLQPGQSIQLSCPHGVVGSVSARTLDVGGKPRRKSRAKKG